MLALAGRRVADSVALGHPKNVRVDEKGTHLRRLEHAQWRVAALRSLLGSHRSLRNSRPSWYQQESNYVNRLTAAQAELDRLSAL